MNYNEPQLARINYNKSQWLKKAPTSHIEQQVATMTQNELKWDTVSNNEPK